MLKRILFSLAMVFIAASYSRAQITTSSITGNAIDAATKEPLVGASIVATHTPSGTKYTTLSTKSGEFTIHDMRVGGPYVVVISFVGFESVTFDDVQLKLAEPFLLEVTLNKKAGTLENVIISTTKRNPILNSSRTGAMTNIGVQAIQNLPSINRSVNDFTRLTPQANGTSIGGGNYRQNKFTVDGADFNNSFGIGINLPANGSPISIDGGDETSEINLINNYFRPGPATNENMRAVFARIEQRSMYSPGSAWKEGDWYPEQVHVVSSL